MPSARNCPAEADRTRDIRNPDQIDPVRVPFDLRLLPGLERCDVTHVQVVSPAIIGQVQPGATVPCKVDPSDHSTLMIGLG